MIVGYAEKWLNNAEITKAPDGQSLNRDRVIASAMGVAPATFDITNEFAAKFLEKAWKRKIERLQFCANLTGLTCLVLACEFALSDRSGSYDSSTSKSKDWIKAQVSKFLDERDAKQERAKAYTENETGDQVA